METAAQVDQLPAPLFTSIACRLRRRQCYSSTMSVRSQCLRRGVHSRFWSRAGLMEKRSILIQLDSDPHPSVFDRVVAIDAGADEVFSYGGVKPEHVREFVHGAIFTRGGKSTQAHRPVHRRQRCVRGRASARRSPQAHAAAVWAAGIGAARCQRRQHDGGSRGAWPRRSISICAPRPPSCSAAPAPSASASLACWCARERPSASPPARRTAPKPPARPSSPRNRRRSSSRSAVGLAGGLHAACPGRTLVDGGRRRRHRVVTAPGACVLSQLRVAIDLNAVPPLGIEGIEVGDKAALRDGVFCYGALGVGGTKMKIHRAAISKLFETNTLVMDAEEVFDLASVM